MKNLRITLLCMGIAACLVTPNVARSTTTNLLSFRSSWRVLSDGSNPGSSWMRSSFNDSFWLSQSGLFGFGDGDQNFTLPARTGLGESIITYYFRKAFVAGDLSNCAAIRLDLIRDDGAIVYINESEVMRSNMGPGLVGRTTRALSDINGAAERTPVTRYLDPAWLSGKTNLVAVEIHQASQNNVDVAFDLTLIGIATAPPPTLVRGPYLQSGAPSAVTVCWSTDLQSDSRVWYSEWGSGVTNSVFLNDAVARHAVRVTGLSPDTRYEYGVGTSNLLLRGMDASHVFETSPPAGTSAPVRIWVIGDSGTANDAARAVRDYMQIWTAARPIDFWMMLGDNAYDLGRDSEYEQAVFQIYTNQLPSKVLWSTLGNHDGYTAESITQSGPYYDIFNFPRSAECGGLASGTEAYYSFDYANIHFVCLESYGTDRSTGGAMLTWLRNDLATTTQNWIIAYWHHPPYTKGSHNSDSEFELIQMRQNALPILEQGGVDLVLCGHSHSYERSRMLHGHYGQSGTLTGSHVIDGGDGRVGGDGAYTKLSTTGAVYVVCGSSGKISVGSLNHPVMEVSLNSLGSMILDVQGDRMDVHFLGTSQVHDRFTLVKRGDYYTLTTGMQGAGEVSPMTDIFVSGSTVTVSAVAAPYHSFEHWLGDVGGTSAVQDVTVLSNMTATARFEPHLVSHNVPVYWLVDQGLSTNDADAFIDADLDGLLAWQEFHAGTLENNVSSLFSVASLSMLTLTNAQAVLQWSSVSGQLYTVSWSDDLSSPGVAVATNLVATYPVNTYIDARGPSVTGGVYRLQTWRP